MTEANIESVEIDLEPFEDDTTTNFSDNEQIPVEHINFEFEQLSKPHGIHRQFTIFNDTHCYQSVKIKHQRKYKFRIDLAYLDPRPFRIRIKPWKWLYASLALLGLDVALILTGWLDTSSINFFGIFTAVTVVAVMCLLAFFYYSRDKVIFRSQYGRIKLVELINKNPDNARFRSFVNKFVVQINKSKTAKGLNQSKLLALELRELRRLKDEAIVPEVSYEKAKQVIFKHEAFSAND
ncbi:MAG: hypothetical protein OES20_08830 [Gammaproteobacteria bacterium]|nr:hypothetical protein [Gammaproteobacteria bacterium]MDH3857184.1 hypothetical protein [Gammaproteobacteria bacterium]